MKKLLVSLIIIMISFLLPAQEVVEKEKPDHGKSLIGVTAGLSMATNIYDYGTLGGEPPSGYIPMPAAGLTFDFESKGSFSFLMGLYFKGKGNKIDMAEYVAGWTFPSQPGSAITAEAEGTLSTQTYWIEFPLAFTFNFGRPNRFQIGFGAFAAYGLTGKVKNDFTIDYYLDNNFLTSEVNQEENELLFVDLLEDPVADEETIQMSRFDYGIYLMMGYKFPSWTISISSSLGIANLNPMTGEDFLTATPSEKVIQSFTPTLSFSYFFKH